MESSTAALILSPLSILFCGGLLIYVLRVHGGRIISVEKKLCGKADRDMCDEKHANINVRFLSGDQHFSELHKDIKEIKTQLSDMAVAQARQGEKLDGWMRQNGN
jgi:hypothetical protein